MDTNQYQIDTVIRGPEGRHGEGGHGGAGLRGLEAAGRRQERHGRAADGKDFVNWFVGWAEGEEEQPLVVVTMIEGGGAFQEGSEMTAGPAVRHILEAYYGVEQSPKDPHPTVHAHADACGATLPGERDRPQPRRSSVNLLLASLPSPPSPVMFEVGPFALRYYGLCHRARHRRRDLAHGEGAGAQGLWTAPWPSTRCSSSCPLASSGRRAYHVVTDYELYAGDPFPGVFEVWNGGLGIYGGVVGGFVGLLIFARIRGISPWAFADAVAPGLVLAQAIGRWGNYFNQELFGRPSDLPWAIRIAPENRPVGLRGRHVFPPDLPLRVDLGRC